MDQTDWTKVSKILEDVLAVEPAKRKQFLDQIQIKKDIRREIEILLSLEEKAEKSLHLSAFEFTDDFFEEDEINPNIGQQIGVYEIKEEIGFGGMGAVYLGERTDEKFSQKVAIKMLRRELNTKKIRKTFRQERMIQASLVHPNIAALLDAGKTADGIPYLVMEYVEGIRIDKYCEDKNLKLNDRLKLFNKVCEAVSFAHQNLVIHRDIKPSNIIITKDGEPKLLDFGISKLMVDSGETTQTITRIGALTPDFASPEQIKGNSVTTAADVYSLGVVLYKLLTGKMPYDASDKPNTEIFHGITKSPPTAPSEAILRRGDGEMGRRGESETTLEKLPPSPRSRVSPSQLKGDLDNIILKALRKEPERRYRTVEQFSADIWRFIDDLPVTARPATFSYRAKKFYGRNKFQVIAGILIFLSLIAGISVAVWQANEAREQARLAAEEAERAKKITEFMGDIIAYANPAFYAEGSDKQGDARVIDVLNEMSNKIETEFPKEPDIQAELHHKFAEVYTIRFNFFKEESLKEKALTHARKALELRRTFYGERHELVAKDMYYLWANISKSKDKDQEESAKLLAEAIKIMREADPENLNLPHMLLDYSKRLWMEQNKDDFEIYYRNAVLKLEMDRLTLGENYLNEAQNLFLQHYPKDHNVVKYGRCHLAMVQAERKKFKQAIENFRYCHQVKAGKNFEAKIAVYAEKLENEPQK